MLLLRSGWVLRHTHLLFHTVPIFSFSEAKSFSSFDTLTFKVFSSASFAPLRPRPLPQPLAATSLLLLFRCHMSARSRGVLTHFTQYHALAVHPWPKM